MPNLLEPWYALSRAIFTQGLLLMGMNKRCIACNYVTKPSPFRPAPMQNDHRITIEAAITVANSPLIENGGVHNLFRGNTTVYL